MESSDEKVFKRIWIIVRRFDLAESYKPPVMLREIKLTGVCTSLVVMDFIRTELHLIEPNIILKLRNQKGSLIIPKGTIEENLKTFPYSLEVTRIHQTVRPQEKSILFPEYIEVLKTTFEGYLSRLDRLERELPELSSKKQYKVEKEIQELDRRLSFLEKRFEEAEHTKWQGKLENNPLW